MVTTAQIFTILGILSAPMISIAALVLTLAALNLSLGIRRLFVKILAFTFDYATKIKRDREVSINSNVSSNEPSTPLPTTKPTKVAPPVVEKSPDDPIDINSERQLISESKTKVNNENETESSNEVTTSDQDQKISRESLQTDIQFKLGKNFY
jgi:uncharacterized membrane protein YraQ (UPF0718 family)